MITLVELFTVLGVTGLLLFWLMIKGWDEE